MPLYFVESVMGNTMEVTPNLEVAREYVAAYSHHALGGVKSYRIYKQLNGILTEV